MYKMYRVFHSEVVQFMNIYIYVNILFFLFQTAQKFYKSFFYYKWMVCQDHTVAILSHTDFAKFKIKKYKLHVCK